MFLRSTISENFIFLQIYWDLKFVNTPIEYVKFPGLSYSFEIGPTSKIAILTIVFRRMKMLVYRFYSLYVDIIATQLKNP